MDRMNKDNQHQLQTATFAAGCFWGVQEVFDQTPGVKETTVGYTGGEVKNPTYEMVCFGKTGHAEAVELKFDPKEISYEQLLDVFWDNHNPTTPNRQGPDVGSQYRSVIFYHNSKQKAIAEKSKKALEKSGKWPSPIVTAIVPAQTFYRAEGYHQKYHQKHGGV
jgi:peptide-methionine (S)-S-oxide reductase